MPEKKEKDHELDLDRVAKLKRFLVTDGELAGLLGLTINRIRELKESDDGFRLACDRGEAQGKVLLRRKQFNRAMSGDSQMLKWMGKQYLGQADRTEPVKGDGPSLWDAIEDELGFSEDST